MFHFTRCAPLDRPYVRFQLAHGGLTFIVAVVDVIPSSDDEYQAWWTLERKDVKAQGECGCSARLSLPGANCFATTTFRSA